LQKLHSYTTDRDENAVISTGPVLARAGAMHVDVSSFNDITREILGAAIEVHRTLGPGLLESIYAPCLQFELTIRKLKFVAQRPIPIVYKGIPLEISYRIDLIVEDLVVVEVKSVAALTSVFEAQLLTYLQLTHCAAGLLINFNVPRLMDGVKRLINPRAALEKRCGVTAAPPGTVTEKTEGAVTERTEGKLTEKTEGTV
jgi:GxxExxY protein